VSWDGPPRSTSLPGVCTSVLESWLAALPERQREVLRLRFEEDLTQSEIGERLGISQMQVSRLLCRSLAHLQEMAARDEERSLLAA
jgi:RNA polymerase sigma-B factor